ncbi:MAG: DUF1893 domain-containing protein [Bacteroidales bacterium]|nr:DUF1893 domain-containing protein [Bacteroidales bacterium]
MAGLIKKLDQGNFSCVIEKDNEVRTYTQKGVQDLYDLVKAQEPFLKDAKIADKVIGKGAAALIVLGGFSEAFAHTISTSAKEMLQSHGVHVTFDTEVDHIINNAKTDWCPLEKRVKDCNSAEDCFPIIEEFVQELRMRK